MLLTARLVAGSSGWPYTPACLKYSSRSLSACRFKRKNSRAVCEWPTGHSVTWPQLPVGINKLVAEMCVGRAPILFERALQRVSRPDSTVLTRCGEPSSALEACAPDESAGRDHRDTGYPRNERARRCELFHKDEDRHRSHPDEIHNAHHEEHAHQRPATAEAVRTVLDPHAQRAERPIAPAGHQESERAAAVRQARGFQRRELIDTRRDEDDAAERRTRRRHHLRQHGRLM